MELLLISIILLLSFVYGGLDVYVPPPDAVAGPIVNDQSNGLSQISESSQSHEALHYLSNPWVISVCLVVGIVFLFYYAVICYLECSKSKYGRLSFLNKSKRKGYSNVANIDSEDISCSEMEQININ